MEILEETDQDIETLAFDERFRKIAEGFAIGDPSVAFSEFKAYSMARGVKWRDWTMAWSLWLKDRFPVKPEPPTSKGPDSPPSPPAGSRRKTKPKERTAAPFSGEAETEWDGDILKGIREFKKRQVARILASSTFRLPSESLLLTGKTQRDLPASARSLLAALEGTKFSEMSDPEWTVVVRSLSVLFDLPESEFPARPFSPSGSSGGGRGTCVNGSVSHKIEALAEDGFRTSWHSQEGWMVGVILVLLLTLVLFLARHHDPVPANASHAAGQKSMQQGPDPFFGRGS